MEKSLTVKSYPEPDVSNIKTIKINVYVKHYVELVVPSQWDDERIENLIKEHYIDFVYYDETLEDIEIL